MSGCSGNMITTLFLRFLKVSIASFCRDLCREAHERAYVEAHVTCSILELEAVYLLPAHKVESVGIESPYPYLEYQEPPKAILLRLALDNGDDAHTSPMNPVLLKDCYRPSF